MFCENKNRLGHWGEKSQLRYPKPLYIFVNDSGMTEAPSGRSSLCYSSSGGFSGKESWPCFNISPLPCLKTGLGMPHLKLPFIRDLAKSIPCLRVGMGKPWQIHSSKIVCGIGTKHPSFAEECIRWGTEWRFAVTTVYLFTIHLLLQLYPGPRSILCLGWQELPRSSWYSEQVWK